MSGSHSMTDPRTNGWYWSVRNSTSPMRIAETSYFDCRRFAANFRSGSWLHCRGWIRLRA
jgi:hypothetical protein